MTLPEELTAAIEEGERLLDTLPPLSPDRESARLAVARLKVDLDAISGSVDETYATLAGSRDILDAALATLLDIKRKSRRH